MKRRVVEIRNGSHGTFQTVSNWLLDWCEFLFVELFSFSS